MLEQLTQTAVQYMDTAMVGSLGTAATAAVGATTTVNWMVGSIVSAAGTGFLAFIARQFGAGRPDRAQQASAQACTTALALGSFLTFITMAAAGHVPVWMQAAPEIRDLAACYFMILYMPMLFRTASILFGMVLMLVVAAVVIAMHAFLFNPLETGSARFFLRNLNTGSEVRELAYCYDHGYLNVVKTIFFKDLYIFLWMLLFIVPGVVKAYEYRMIPYLLAENPEMPKKEVFARSKEMMRGQKWKAFVLDLSFLGWGLLSLLTLGIVGVFYVNPYRNMTNAALYEKLMYGLDPQTGQADELPAEIG